MTPAERYYGIPQHASTFRVGDQVRLRHGLRIEKTPFSDDWDPEDGERLPKSGIVEHVDAVPEHMLSATGHHQLVTVGGLISSGYWWEVCSDLSQCHSYS